ncbi:MAG: hypothetical protein JF563_06585, partial [Acidobacteriales bacterium]|nr:hypothetical protein [Terriglobales bacterium]
MSDVSTVASKPRIFKLTGKHLIIAGAILLIVAFAVFLYRDRAIEIQSVSP